MSAAALRPYDKRSTFQNSFKANEQFDIEKTTVIGSKSSSEHRIHSRVILRMLAFTALVLASLSAESAIYKWVDRNGKTHFSDAPPDTGAQEITPERGPSDVDVRDARDRLERTLRRLKRKEEIKNERRAKERQRKAAAQQQAARDKGRCTRLQRDLHVLQQQRPVYSINEKGEQIYLDDETRKMQIEQLKEMISTYCQK